MTSLSVELTKKQTQAMQKLTDANTRTIVFGGSAGGGKSWLGCVWLITMCLTYPNTKWFIGREQLKILKESTYVTFLKVSNILKLSGKWKYNAQYNFITFTNGSVISMLALDYKPSDPMYERYGSTEYTGGWIEEAGEVHFNAFDTLKSRTGRQYNDVYGLVPKILITCNPKKNWLYSLYYKPFKSMTLDSESCFIQALVTDNPKIDKVYIENLYNMKNEIQKQRLLYGVWEYEDEPEQLIKYEWVENCFYSFGEKGKKTLGVDVARYGNDESSVSKMEGNILTELKNYKNYDTATLAQLVIDKLVTEHIDCDRIGVDSVGIGAGVVDILKREKYPIREIISGETPKTFKETKTYNFFNLRSQMWWVMREDLRLGNIRINLEFDDQLTQKLIEDLTAPCYEIRGEETIKVEKKDEIKQRLGRSTDCADSFVYANWIRHLHLSKPVLDENPIIKTQYQSLSSVLF